MLEKNTPNKNCLSIRLSESAVFLRTDDPTGRRRIIDAPPTSMLRGLLTLELAKPTKITSIDIELQATTSTALPEGMHPSCPLSPPLPIDFIQASERAALRLRNSIVPSMLRPFIFVLARPNRDGRPLSVQALHCPMKSLKNMTGTTHFHTPRVVMRRWSQPTLMITEHMGRSSILSLPTILTVPIVLQLHRRFNEINGTRVLIALIINAFRFHIMKSMTLLLYPHTPHRLPFRLCGLRPQFLAPPHQARHHTPTGTQQWQRKIWKSLETLCIPVYLASDKVSILFMFVIISYLVYLSVYRPVFAYEIAPRTLSVSQTKHG